VNSFTEECEETMEPKIKKKCTFIWF